MDAGLHPPWCFQETCQAADGGSHMSVQREIPLAKGAVLSVRLVAMPGLAPSIELDVHRPASDTSPDSRITLPVSRARELISAVSGCMWAAIGSRFGSTDIDDPQLQATAAPHRGPADSADAAT